MPVLSEVLKEQIRAYFPQYPNKQAVTLPALHVVQAELRCVPLESVYEIAHLLGLSPAEVRDTMSFYGFFREETRPAGLKRVWVCQSLACMLRGSEEVLRRLCSNLGLERLGHTTPDGRVSVEVAECIGACEGAPCLLIDDEHRMNVTVERAEQLARELMA